MNHSSTTGNLHKQVGCFAEIDDDNSNFCPRILSVFCPNRRYK